MLKKYQIRDDALIESDTAEANILAYVTPDEADKKHLINDLQIDEHTLDSALDPNELSRIEFDANHIAIIIKRPKRYCSADNFVLKISSIGLFLFPDKLFIVTKDENNILEERPLHKVSSIKDLLLKVVHRCVKHFEEHLRVINMISDELEQKINKSMENRHLYHLFSLEKSLVYYLYAIHSNNKVIDKLIANAAKCGMGPDEIERLDDIHIENNQCYEQANTYSQVLSGLMDARVSIVNNNLNISMKKLTYVMLAMMAPTLVISVFSMNVKLPLDQDHSAFSFWVIMILSLLTVIVVYFYAKRERKN
ncbi:MAG: hypothetical protein A2017_05830 [Lentisphaerae bacterium GWF2_44_16]|nr:MAG: hypothetical protein A2017_05830 [Lentisphaerae bacterium GWF2_44_16]